MSRTLEEYEQNGGWSSHFFATHAVKIMKELQASGVEVALGRTVIHLTKNNKKIKVYVHHNGRNREYATVTDKKGIELMTAHYTEVDNLSIFIKEYLCQ